MAISLNKFSLYTGKKDNKYTQKIVTLIDSTQTIWDKTFQIFSQTADDQDELSFQL